MTGGFVQGGGQGPLSGIYGVGSDNAVSFDVVLASGKVVTADATHYPDLFWALKGGGMATYGVVLSATFKTHKAVPVVGMQLQIMDSDSDRFWEGVRIWYTAASSYTEKGMYVWYVLSEGSLNAQPFVAPNMTAAQFKAVVNPMLDRLRAANVSFTTSPVREFTKFGDLYNEMWEFTHHGSGSGVFWGGRMVSQRDVNENGDAVVQAYRDMSNRYPGQVAFGGHLVNPGYRIKDPLGKLSAVHPVWRETADIEVFLFFPPPCMSKEQRTEAQRKVTQDLQPILDSATPHSAVYSNEVRSPSIPSSVPPNLDSVAHELTW